MANDAHPVTAVPLLDLKRQLPDLEAPLTAAFLRVVRSGQYILGGEVQAFEAAAAPIVGCAHTVGVSSGTDALLLSLMALGIAPGDGVICPTYTFFATAGSIWRLHAKPIFVDSCPGCFNALPSAMLHELGQTPAPKAVLPVHLFGQQAHLREVRSAAASAGVPVVEDAAQALGAQSELGPAGSLGTCGCFSFFPSKNLGGFGDAGLISTNDALLAEHLRILRGHGGKPKYHHNWVGGNFRIDALQAALLAVKLPHLEAYSGARQRNAAAYTELFLASGLAEVASCICEGGSFSPGAPIVLPAVRQKRHTFNQYVIRLNGAGLRQNLRQSLAADGIGHEVYYPVPLHLQPCFADLRQRSGQFPHAESAAEQTLALPIFPELRPDEIERVVAHVVAHVAAAGQRR